MSNAIAKIDFYGDNIIAFEDNGEIYVSIQQTCNVIGLNKSAQYKKIDADPVYQAGLQGMSINTLFGNQETRFLQRKFYFRWLNSISTARVKDPKVRDMLIKYQLECTEVIDEYFTKGIVINPRADGLDLLTERVEKLEARLSNKAPLHQQKKNMLHEKAKSGILEAISTEGKTTEQLYAHFSRHISALVLHTALMELERENLIAALIKATGGRYATLYQRL